MKGDRNRKVKDYSECRDLDMDYHGLFRKNGKLRIDVKRASKIDDGPFDEGLVKKINAIPRNTAYFFPKKKRREEYMCNIFKDYLDEIRKIWCTEIRRMIKNIKTPEEAGDDAYLANIMDGVVDPEECGMIRNYEKMIRSRKYPSVMNMIYAQFIHNIASVVELAQIDVMKRAGHEMIHGGRGKIKEILKKEYGIEMEKIPNYQFYDGFYGLWNFTKHNSMSAYTQLKRASPEMLNDAPFVSGNYSLSYLILDEETIFDLIKNLQTFFNSFCESVFKEDLEEASWNYDGFFIKLFREWREDVENPLGLPWYI